MIDLEHIKGFNDENTNNDLARKLKGNTEEKPIRRCLLETVKCLLLMSFLGQKVFPDLLLYDATEQWPNHTTVAKTCPNIRVCA